MLRRAVLVHLVGVLALFGARNERRSDRKRDERRRRSRPGTRFALVRALWVG